MRHDNGITLGLAGHLLVTVHSLLQCAWTVPDVRVAWDKLIDEQASGKRRGRHESLRVEGGQKWPFMGSDWTGPGSILTLRQILSHAHIVGLYPSRVMERTVERRLEQSWIVEPAERIASG